MASFPELDLPEALMAFLHADSGRPFETARPQALAAAAELAELVLAGHARLDGNQILVDAPATTNIDWVREVTTELCGQPVEDASWIKTRKQALAVHQARAVDHGLLIYDRARLFGIFDYARHRVEPAGKQALIDAMCDSRAVDDPRLAALARILWKTRLHLRHDLDDDQRSQILALAEKAADLPVPRLAIRAVDVAVAYAIYTTFSD